MNPSNLRSAAGRRTVARATVPLALVLPWAVLQACVDSTGPPHPLIEATEFAPALDVDLEAMTRIDGGLYVEDLVVGEGREVGFYQEVVLAYDLHLPDGRLVIHQDSAKFIMGCYEVVSGLEAGVRGMRVGGARRIVVPPRLGYGERAPWPLEIPPFSILVYEAEVLRTSGRRCPGSEP
ncbi:MAG: FKBP-type peptidyl-prolyl cis-trans isomerase [Gemmatimonadota bacterium]